MESSRFKASAKKQIAFFDFDNTITQCDVLDDLITRFSQNENWKDLEEEWKAGRIGSKECLTGQLKEVSITKDSLDDYLSNVKIDPYFKRLVDLLSSYDIKTAIASDSFDYILKTILKSNGISIKDIYSNKLRLEKGRLIPDFPFTNTNCEKCGHCKRDNILQMIDKKNTIVYYIGDGLSDVCASEHADVVFAKEFLSEYFSKKQLPYIAFKDMKDIYGYFNKIFKKGYRNEQ